MCGIAGHIGPALIADARVERCLTLMARRGPDGSAARRFTRRDGSFVDLLHARLSIIDLDARSNQPFAAHGLWLSFNGEIYNYRELRGELERDGVPLHTVSDTEVLAAGLARHGRHWLDRCEGMWAFAAFDEATDEVLLSRDRFGEKPLYLLRDGRDLFFGSEPKFLFALSGLQPRANVDQVRRFLVNGYRALYKQPATFFEGVEELPPATVAMIGLDREARSQYWTPRPNVEPDMTREQAVAGARDRLLRSMEIRLRSDVPLAFCMSGGVDSNALISIAKRVFDYDVEGFTIGGDDPRYDEWPLVFDAVRELDIRHTAVRLDRSDFLPRLATLVRQHDAPVYTISYYIHWLLMERIAGAGYRVSISGTGADEIFSGYYDHQLAYLQSVDGTAALAGALAGWETHVQPHVRNPHLRNPRLFIDDPGFRDHIYMEAAAFASYLSGPWHEPFTETRYTGRLLRDRMMNELFCESVPVILHEDDLNAMYYSVENRSPYLDRSLAEFSWSIPDEHLIQAGFAKSILRDAVRAIAPDAVVDNPRKVGFNAPLGSLLALDDAAVRGAILSDSPIYDVVRRDRVAGLLEKPSVLPNSESKFLFSVLSAKAFLEQCQ